MQEIQLTIIDNVIFRYQLLVKLLLYNFKYTQIIDYKLNIVNSNKQFLE